MISGTSVDAIDTAVADLSWDGDAIRLRPLGQLERPWPAELRRRFLAALPPAQTTAAELCALDTLAGQEFAAAAVSAIEAFADGSADLVVSHGQTVYHWVLGGMTFGTLQVGQPAWIVQATGLPVISDLRARDVAAGGHGAPLACMLDALWLAGSGTEADKRTRAALNIGGIANITVVGGPGDPVLAYDTGPGNCLLDLAATRVTGGERTADVDGELALSGRVRHDLLAGLLHEPYYALPPPKSTGRELFHGGYLDNAVARLETPVSSPDLLATLTELTAITIAAACARHRVSEVVASGGGTRNPALLAALRHRLAPTTLLTSDQLGLPAGAKEAYLFTLLGFLSWYQVPGVPVGATGAAVPRVLGRISPPDAPFQLPPPAPSPRRLVIDPPS